MADTNSTATEAAHTPGPWIFEPGPHGDPDLDDCDFMIAEQRRRGDVVATVIGPVRFGATEANARLIAAAPDLIAACKASLTAKHNKETNTLLLSAINKAEGGKA